MTPNISADTARLYATRILYGAPERLTPDDLAARTALITVCAVIAPGEPPAAECLGSRTIDDYHIAWLTQLPMFSRIAYIAIERDFYTGRPCKRIYLLADWLATSQAIHARETRLRAQSDAWIEERVRWYRLRRRLCDMYDMPVGVAQAQIEAHYRTVQCRVEVAVATIRQLLATLGFDAPISDEDRALYETGHRSAMGRLEADGSTHAWASVIDFKNFP